MKNILRGLLLGLAALVMPRVAAESRFAIRFEVVDEYTRQEMEADSLLIDVMRPDSTILFNALPLRQFKREWFERQELLLRLRQHGFITQYVKIAKPGKRIEYLNLDRVIMPRDLRINRGKVTELNEVTVTASVLKMVHRGDTLVYNADAFELAQGSMLDQLVRSLPGVELRAGGRIYVNGRYVESLMLNGKDFFKGNPTVALANLPSYTVAKIKVYEKETALNRIDPAKVKPLVMDVGLKKEYMSGQIANADAGYGTRERYEGRLFGLNFRNLSRVALFANSNNTNDVSTPGEEEYDNQASNRQDAGMTTTHKAGLNYMLSAADNSWEFNPSLTACGTITSKREDTRQTLFVPSGTMQRLSRLHNQDKNLDLLLTPNFKYDKRKLFLEINPSLRYRKSNNDYRLSSDMSANGSSLNTENRQQQATGQRLEGNLDLNSMLAVPSTPDYISLNVKADFQDNTGATNGSYLIDYPHTPANNRSNVYNIDAPQKAWQVTGTTDYYARTPQHNGRSTKMKGYYQYSHSYRQDTHSYYDAQTTDIEPIPSYTVAERLTFSIDNSYRSQTISNTHTIGGFIHQYFKKWSIYLSPNLTLSHRSLHYHRFGQDYNLQSSNILPGGEAEITLNNYFRLESTFRLITPSMLDILNIADHTNPLYIRCGNPNLKNSRNLSLNLKLTWVEKILHSHTWATAQIRYNRTDLAIAQAATYDYTTGITTYRPQNINGNWTANALLSCGYYLNRKKTLILSTETNANYINSTDLVNNSKSIVRTTWLDQRLKLDWKIIDGVNVATLGNAKWRHSTSPSAAFNRINALDFNYGITLNATRLPRGLALSSDLTMHSRRGYSNAQLNSNFLVWNLRLAKSINHGNLTFALDGYDLLGQLSNVAYDINAQGRTETHFNTLPRYAMLHIIYRLNISHGSR